MPSAASSHGVTVDYLHLGGDGAPLLFAHATGFCATVWRPVAQALPDRYSCWALDFRGHGRTNSPVDGDFDWQGTADDVLAVIDAVASPGPWFGVGHSMGGAALLLAEQRRPGTLAAAWVYEPIVFPGTIPPGSDRGNPLAEAARRRRAGFESAAAARDNYSSKPPMNAFDPRALDGYLERGLAEAPDGTVRLACEPADEASVYEMGPVHSAWEHLAEVSCPVTVAVGDTSVPGPAAFAAPVAGRLPHGRLEPHPDLGHFGPLEAPDRIAAAIAGSLSGPTPTIAP